MKRAILVLLISLYLHNLSEGIYYLPLEFANNDKICASNISANRLNTMSVTILDRFLTGMDNKHDLSEAATKEESAFISRNTLSNSWNALIYRKNQTIFAVDSENNVISSGTAGIDDSDILQAAVDKGGLIILKCNLRINRIINVTENYVTIMSPFEVDPSWQIDSAPIAISGGGNDIFHISGFGFSIIGITFNDVHRCLVFSPAASQAQIRVAAIEKCTFVNLHDTPIIYDTANGYLVGPIKIIDNHFYAIGDFPKTSGEVIPSYIKFVGMDNYEITGVMIERNDFNSGAIRYIDIDINEKGFIEFVSFQSNYFEGTEDNTAKIYIDCDGGRAIFYCAIRDCKIGGDPNSVHGAKGIELHARNNGSIEMNGFVNNYICASDIIADVGMTRGDISGLQFSGNNLEIGDLRFEQIDQWRKSNIHGVSFIGNQVKSDIFAKNINGFTFSNNVHSDITLNIDGCNNIIIRDNIQDWAEIRALILKITDTSDILISGNSAYRTEASGSSVGMGYEQSIKHDLSALPAGCKAWIKYLAGDRYITETIPFDAENIYPRVDAGVAYEWRIE